MKVFDIRTALNSVQSDIMTDWEQKTKLKIGVSIQIFNQVQDNYSETREAPANNYCKNIVANKTQLRLCDLLDFHLKQFVDNKKNLKGISCRCHKGVSNIMIPFHFNDVVWYIFYGQFLLVLSNHPDDLTNVSPFYEKILKRKFDDNNIIYNLDDKKNKYYKPNSIIDILKDTQFLDTDISKVDIIDFFQFKTYVETQFTFFLKSIYNDPFKEKPLTDFINKSKPTNRILLLIDRLFDIYKNYENENGFINEQDRKNKVLLVLNQLRNISKKLDSDSIIFLESLLAGETTGTIFNNSWIHEATTLVKKYS